MFKQTFISVGMCNLCGTPIDKDNSKYWCHRGVDIRPYMMYTCLSNECLNKAQQLLTELYDILEEIPVKFMDEKNKVNIPRSALDENGKPIVENDWFLICFFISNNRKAIYAQKQDFTLKMISLEKFLEYNPHLDLDSLKNFIDGKISDQLYNRYFIED